MSKKATILFLLSFSIICSVCAANTQVTEYNDIETAQGTNYTTQQIQQRNLLYSQQNQESTSIVTPQISANQLVNQVNIEDVYNKKSIDQFMSQVNLSAIQNISQASSLIIQATNLINENISLKQLTSIVNLCDSVIEYSSEQNFSSVQGFQADTILLNIGKLWSTPTFSADKIQMLINLQDKIFNYVLKNNISYSEDVPKFLVEQIAKITWHNPQLTKVFDSKNQQVGWLLQNLKDYYLPQGSDFLDIDNEKWAKWKKIIQNPLPDVPKNDYKVPNGKFMFQVWTPQSSEQLLNLYQQLDFIKNNGYIGVVVVWDGTSDYQKLVQTQQVIKSKGLRIWLAFSTLKYDEITKTTFVQPQYFAQGLEALAKESQAFLMGWRRTSIHTNIQVKAWQNYVMNALRKGNPNIGFIGEAYFGYNGTHSVDDYHLYLNYRDNYNAVLAVNFGFISVNPQWALSKLKSVLGDKNVQYICLIQGVTSLYLQDYPGKRKRTLAQYRRINQIMEKRFLKAGFDAVAGIAGDGANRLEASDDLCLSKHHIPSNEKF